MKSGDVIILNFPFSDLSGSKLRPAIIVARGEQRDLIACQITSNRGDPDSVSLEQSDFVKGGLRLTSYARPGKLFTANHSIVRKVVGRITDKKRIEMKNAIIRKIEEA